MTYSVAGARRVKVPSAGALRKTPNEPAGESVIPRPPDPSGYPKGTRNISYVGQLLGIIDCYEALTNEDRPYRRARDPLETLKFLKEDVQAGKFNRDIFEKFCYSLI